MTHLATALPYARLEAIEGQLRAIVDAGTFNGSITIHFAAGCPMKVQKTSIHSEADGWAFATEPLGERG